MRCCSAAAEIGERCLKAVVVVVVVVAASVADGVSSAANIPTQQNPTSSQQAQRANCQLAAIGPTCLPCTNELGVLVGSLSESLNAPVGQAGAETAFARNRRMTNTNIIEIASRVQKHVTEHIGGSTSERA